MDNSFQKDIKDVLTSIDNDGLSSIKSKYNKVYGEDGYDKLISNINDIENNYLVDGTYDKTKMGEVAKSLSMFYESTLDDEIKTKKLDLRKKESLLESFQSRLNDLINSYGERIEYNEIQNKRKY